MSLKPAEKELDESSSFTESARQTKARQSEEANPFLRPLGTKARPSNIKNLCERALKDGHKECVWLCFNRRTRFVVRSIPITQEGASLEIFSFRNRCGWWKRISLRSAVKIQEVKVHVIREQNTEELEVMVLPVDYSLEIANVERLLQDWPLVGTCDAGYNVDGTLQRCTAGGLCPNFEIHSSEYDQEEHCAQERYHKLRLRLRNLQYRQPLLDFYWNSRGKSDCEAFLRSSDLVTQYSDLMRYHYLDAVCYGNSVPGESIPALLLVDGWKTSRLLILIGFAISTGIIVTVIGTAAGHGISDGLTAGSYAFGIVSVLIATLTFFSAIL